MTKDKFMIKDGEVMHKSLIVGKAMCAIKLNELQAANETQAQRIQELEKAHVMQWRPISEAPKDDIILGYHADWDAPFCIEYNGDWCDWRSVWDEDEVIPTHWMPLPKPPKEKKK